MTSNTAMDELLADLGAEYARLDAILASLPDSAWATPSGAEGWSIADVVTHLAVSEEGVAATIAAASPTWTEWDGRLDDAMDAIVRANRAAPPEVLARWRAATASSLDALAGADPNQAVTWAAAPLRPRTLATTRLAEHWAHGLDIAGPLGIDLPDTDRLRHVAWLGHATIPYGCALAGLDPQPVRVELTGPGGDTWVLGPADAASRISGEAGTFCRVGAQRLAPQDSGLHTEGPFGATALSVLRNYAT